MTDTTATARKEILEEHKQVIDAEKERVRLMRDKAIEEGNSLLADILDKRIDDLQLEKDNLPVSLFGDSEELAPEEDAILQRRLDDFTDLRETEEGVCPACSGRGDEIAHGETEGCANCGGSGRVEPEGSDNSVSGQWKEHGYH